MKKVSLKTIIPYLPVVAIALAGMLNVLIATRGGAGAQSDSAFYIGVARNLSAGQGYGLTRPFTGFEFFSIFPPLYSLVLAGLATSGLELIAAARWMNALLFALTIALSGGFFLWKWKSPLAGILISILLAFSPSMISAHAWLLSEPLYYFFGTIALLALIVFLSGQRRSWLILSATAAALAALDRYAGLALVICGLSALLVQTAARPALRLKQMAIFGSISLAPTIIWLWLVRVKSATIAGRELFAPDEVFPRLVSLAMPLKQTLIAWVPFSDLLPFISDPHRYRPFWIITILAGICLVILLVVAIRRNKKGGAIAGQVVLLRVFGMFMACHVLVFMVATLFLTASPATGDRNFAPLLFALYFITATLLVIIQRIYQKNSGANLVAAIATCLLAVVHLATGIRAVAAYPADGLGYNTVSQRQSPIYNAIRELPAELLIVCNNPNVVFFHTDRGSYPIIELYSSDPEWDFPVYGQGANRTDQGQLAFEKGLAALVLLPDAYWEFQFRYGEKTDQRLAGLTEGLYLYYEGPDGKIYLKDDSVLDR